MPDLLQGIGADALPVTAAANLLVGFIIGALGVTQLARFGATGMIPELLVVIQFRELGPLITAVVVAGRSGAGIASEIGAMKVSEEIDALWTMGFDPLRWLVFPRCLALILVVPLLTPVPLGDDVDLDRLARITAGFSGADLANLMNAAALLAVRRGATTVTMEDFNLAIERIVADLQRDMPLEGETRKKVAYHEGGHALVSQLLPLTETVHKVSIIPTSKGALGYTMEMPEEDRYLISKPALEQRLRSCWVAVLQSC